jgi:hypothetical protein
MGSFKIELIEGLVNHFDKIICHNILVHNHAGSFGYIINPAFKHTSSLNIQREKVEVINQSEA